MKTQEQIEKAKSIIRGDLGKNIDRDTRTLLNGMMVALNWVIESPHGSTLERLASGEPIVERGETSNDTEI